LNCYFTPLRAKLRNVRTGVRGTLADCNSAALNCPDAIPGLTMFREWKTVMEMSLTADITPSAFSRNGLREAAARGIAKRWDDAVSSGCVAISKGDRA
jgi:hypothetical protein